MMIRSLRDLPSTDRLVHKLVEKGVHEFWAREGARSVLAAMREAFPEDEISLDDLTAQAQGEAKKLSSLAAPVVVNMSGVILHTGLGRARLAPSVAQEVSLATHHHTALEFDLEEGERGDRQGRLKGLLRHLTGAEDAMVVNNCAGAVILVLSALASGRSVVLSRGEMVEIGGSYRMPDVIQASGARLVEVGCTNKTRVNDYREAFEADTAAILRCHQSNFKQIGFTSSVEDSQLADVAKELGLLFLHDLGSGCLVDPSPFGLPREKTIKEALSAGADLVMASGDKLLGGPQAGLILGRADLIAQVKKHPLARALRVDKLTLAALAGTLRLYAENRWHEIPLWNAIQRPEVEVKEKAQFLANTWPDGAVVPSRTEIGGGTMPGESLPTWCCVLPSNSPDSLARALRATGQPFVVGRVAEGLVWLDPRTATDEEVQKVHQKLAEIRYTLKELRAF
ncbi:MAG: L-seryl-tRNA(Sec) selenium transferase [Fimbriimonadaceae bacterium]|jgi:L-seryl-tRNA(Ser) seleniumtransferase|nr:L-seryl-tRNA(Sec) selenium transferase [Fimbriimonadaceae bacterium]